MNAFIHEIYTSISGEGITTGVPTIFLRVAGCSLRCGATEDGRRLWCDTPYALSPKAGEPVALKDVLSKIQSYIVGFPQILITGGEPLEGENRSLTKAIASEYKNLCRNPNHPFPRIETNGAESIRDLENMVFTLDYKLPGSGMEDRMILDNWKAIKERSNPLDEIKFVVRDRQDFNRSVEVWKEHQPNSWILYSPVEGELDPSELVEWILPLENPKARLSLQIHKTIWGNKRGV
jgi:7-carboxy-7-deazaguanine synthase